MDAIDLLIRAESENINPNFTDTEKDDLVKHYKNDDINQYYDIVIQKVLTENSVKDTRFDITEKLLEFSTNINDKLYIDRENDQDIIANAGSVYKILMVLYPQLKF